MNRMTVYDQTRLCFKVTPHQEQGRSVIQELGIYEDIHEEEIKKARNITDIRDLYFTKGAKLDPYWENLGKPKTERSGWIPVTKKLPEETVLVCMKDGGIFIGNLATVDGKREWHDDGWEHEYNLDEVIAWQPLPDPYEPQESEDKA